MANTKSPHDTTFKALAREKIFAQALIKQHVPKTILKIIDLDSIELWNCSYAKEKKEYHSDVNASAS